MSRCRIHSRLYLVSTLVVITTIQSCRTPGTAPESSVLEAGSPELLVCSGERPFLGNDPQAFDFKARSLTMPNAYWLGAMAAHSYVQADVALAELSRLGFNDREFFDEDGVARSHLTDRIKFRWASTQGFWAEADQGIILAFRGTNPTESGDLITDLWTARRSLDAGTETIGKSAPLSPEEAMAEGAAATGIAGQDIKVHKGFWYALDIVWKHIENRAKRLVAEERPKEIAAKMRRLDEFAATLKSKGEAAATKLLDTQTDWVIGTPGKVKLIRLWSTTDSARRGELFELIDANWASWQKPVFVTGHSLGGALGTLAAYRLMKMGVNIRGLYTFGSPRAGNAAFVHDFRIRAFRKGLKLKGTMARSGEGGLQRFMNHMDVVARVPPVFGWTAGLDESLKGQWQHISDVRYLTGEERSLPELWIAGQEQFSEMLRTAKVPEFTAQLPLEAWRKWGDDHRLNGYVAKLERLAFGTVTTCP